MSKGSNRRPMEISNEEFKRQWDQIFGTGADMRDIAVDKKRDQIDREQHTKKLGEEKWHQQIENPEGLIHGATKYLAQ